MKLLAVVAALFPLASALAFPGPKVTPLVVEPHPQGWTPVPTPAPYFKELVRRQSQVTLDLIEGPDFLCGYQNGNKSDGIGLCGDTDHCGFATAAGEVGDVWCFGTATSSARQTWSSCVYSDKAASCASDSACSDNPGILQCTDSIYSVCNVGTFVGLGVEAVWCDTTDVADEILISTTYPGQIGRSFTAVGGEITSTLTSSSSTPTPTTPIVTTTPTPKPTPIIPTPTPTPTQTPTPKKSTPIGPIVGGVVGGVALIAGFAVAIFLCLRREKKTSPGGASENQSSLPTGPNNNNNNSNFYPPVAPPVHYNEKPTASTQVHYSEVPQSQQYPPQQYPIQQSPPQQYEQYSPQGQHVPPPQQYPQPSVSPAPSQQPVLSGRDSIVSAISSPSSPAPPYVSTVPSVPEVANTEIHPTHFAGPVNDRYEMGS